MSQRPGPKPKLPKSPKTPKPKLPPGVELPNIPSPENMPNDFPRKQDRTIPFPDKWEPIPEFPQNPPNDFPRKPDRTIPSGEGFPDGLPTRRPPEKYTNEQQLYNDLLQRAMMQRQAFESLVGSFNPTPVQPVPMTPPAAAAPAPQVPAVPPAKPNQQAMQNYANLLQQGLQNYQAQAGIPGFAQPQQKAQRNISTAGFPTPKPFG